MTSEAQQLSNLESWFADKKKVAVAFSGGVDSSLLLFVGNRVLGDCCYGLFADSPLIARRQADAALQFARHHVLNIVVNRFSPLSLPGFTANSAERCYICKRGLYSRLLDMLDEDWHLADGSNLDDDPLQRPGSRAITELAVSTPYLDCSINKKQIRNLSRSLGLSTWDKPSESCLATRISKNEEITPHALQRVEIAETVLHELGFAGVRANLAGDKILLTFKEGDLHRAVKTGKREEIQKKLAGCSFSKVFLDLSERPGILP